MTEEIKSALLSKVLVWLQEHTLPVIQDRLMELDVESFNSFRACGLAKFLCLDTSAESLANTYVYSEVFGKGFGFAYNQNVDTLIGYLAEAACGRSDKPGVDFENRLNEIIEKIK